MVTIFDLYIQYFFGENLLGFKSPWDARLSGFFNEELKVAHLLIRFFFYQLLHFIFKRTQENFIYIFYYCIFFNFDINQRKGKYY